MQDLISRQAAIDAYGDWYVEEGTEEGFIGTVKQLLEGTIDDAINAGRELTLDDFLSNCTSENAFYNQNQDGFTRRRICDWYMYSEGKFGVGVYDKSLGKEVKKRYEFTSETPFQDLMRDKEGAKIVDM